MRFASLRALVAVVSGIVIQYFAPMPFWFWVGFGLLVMVSVLITRGYTLLLLVTVVSAVYTGELVRATRLELPPIGPAQFKGVVRNEPLLRRGRYSYDLELQTVSFAGEKYLLNLRVRLSTGRRLSYGDRIRFTGTVLPFAFPRNPGLIDLNEYYRRQGFLGRVRADDLAIVGHEGDWFVATLVMPVRRFIIDVLGRRFAGKNRSLLAGLLLGETGDFPENTSRAFSFAGVIHILAVSGMNVMIVAGTCALLLSTLRISGFGALLITLLILVSYVAVTGFAPSALRAGLMAGMLLIARYAQWTYSPLSVLCSAALLILGSNPLNLLDIGFQLSFIATAAILLFSRETSRVFGGLNRFRRLRCWFVIPLSVTLAGTLSTAPLVLYYFSRVSVISLLANLLIVPLVTLATPSGFLLVVAEAVSPQVGSVVAQTLDLNLSAIIWLTERLGSLPGAGFVVKQPPILFVVWLYLLLLLVMFLIKGSRRRADSVNGRVITAVPLRETSLRWVLRLLSLAVVAGGILFNRTDAFARGKLRITFLDLIQAEASYIEFPDGRNMLIDAGDGRDDIVADFLERQGVVRLNLLAVTHPERHVSAGVSRLLDRVMIDQALVPIDSAGCHQYAKLLAALRASGTDVEIVGRGDEIMGLGAEVRILSPTPMMRAAFGEHRLSANDLSLVLQIVHQGIAVLFTGDLDNAGMLPTPLPRADVLKAPHRGGARAMSRLLLESARPKVVVVQGRRRISAKVEKLLDQSGVQVVSTRRDGAVIMSLAQPGDIRIIGSGF